MKYLYTKSGKHYPPKKSVITVYNERFDLSTLFDAQDSTLVERQHFFNEQTKNLSSVILLYRCDKLIDANNGDRIAHGFGDYHLSSIKNGKIIEVTGKTLESAICQLKYKLMVS